MVKPKIVIPPPPPHLVDNVSKSSEIKQLVRLARVFVRAGAHQPFTVDINLFCSLHIPGKGFRKGNVAPGVRLRPDSIKLGKRDGLIFRLLPIDPIKREGQDVEYIEVTWDDLANNIPELAVKLGEYMGGFDKIPKLNKVVTAAVASNPSMHGILEQGFAKAQVDEREDVNQDELEENPLFGSF